jgi:CubicO group peptidase (beta-lactamase class C family)
MNNFFKLNGLLLVCAVLAFSCITKPEITSPESVGLSSDTLKLADIKMQEYVDNDKLAGVYTLIIKDGKVAQRANYGLADKEKQMPYDNKTIVRIFSMTKPITAVALMILYDEGKIQLDDKVSKFIPEVKDTKVYNPESNTDKLEPQKEEMTIRHLLTHTSGLSYGWDYNSYVDSLYRTSGVSGWDGTIEEKIKLLAKMPLNFQPGSQWKYGLSIDVAGYIVEIISGMPLDEFMKNRIFDPLKMDDTGFYLPEEKYDRFAELYDIDEEGILNEYEGVFKDVYKQQRKLFSGGGGLLSTMDDYQRFCMMLLNGGQLDGVRILKESTVDMIMSDQLPDGVTFREGFGHGLAGMVQFKTGTYRWSGLASTNFWIDPTNDIIIITFTQLFPTDHTYAYDFKDIVYRSIIE